MDTCCIDLKLWSAQSIPTTGSSKSLGSFPPSAAAPGGSAGGGWGSHHLPLVAGLSEYPGPLLGPWTGYKLVGREERFIFGPAVKCSENCFHVLVLGFHVLGGPLEASRRSRLLKPEW